MKPALVVVAYTTGDDRHRDVRRAAANHALARESALILFVADAASMWSEPMPNQWASDRESDQFSSRLGPDDLERLGRSDVAAQVIDGRASGISTFAWLPKDHGAGALAAYAREQDAHIVFVPDKLEWMDELSSVLAGSTKDEDAAVPGIELRTVHAQRSPRPTA
jgi:hypothetical protein